MNLGAEHVNLHRRIAATAAARAARWSAFPIEGPAALVARRRSEIVGIIDRLPAPPPERAVVQESSVALVWGGGLRFDFEWMRDARGYLAMKSQIGNFVRLNLAIVETEGQGAAPVQVPEGEVSMAIKQSSKSASPGRKAGESKSRAGGTTAGAQPGGETSARAGFYGKKLNLSIGATYSHLFVENEKRPVKDRWNDEEILEQVRKEFPGRDNLYPVQHMRNKFNKGLLPGEKLPKGKEAGRYGEATLPSGKPANDLDRRAQARRKVVGKKHDVGNTDVVTVHDKGNTAEVAKRAKELEVAEKAAAASGKAVATVVKKVIAKK